MTQYGLGNPKKSAGTAAQNIPVRRRTCFSFAANGRNDLDRK
jgi:hypothetical protein